MGYTSVCLEATTVEMFGRFVLGGFGGEIYYDISPGIRYDYEVVDSEVFIGEQDLSIAILGVILAYHKNIDAKKQAIVALTAQAYCMF